MSSAVVQPTSVATLNPSSLAPAASSRHYTSSHSSPTREGYHANQQNSTASSSSSRRPSRKNSGNGHGYSNSLNSPASQSNSPMGSRGISSPVAVAAAQTERHTSDRRRHQQPPVAPPRTSSNRHEGSSAASSSRRGQPSDRATESSRRQYDAQNADPAASQGEEVASSSRRRNNAPQDLPVRTSSRDARASAATSRSQGASAGPSKGPSREASEILNSMFVTREEDDIGREKERMAMAVPRHAAEDDDDATPPPIATSTDQGEEKRGSRSRHDHSKREKHTKFGEYILGNTIGEGEFGKVKLGWKEGGQQVAIKLIKKDTLGSNPTRMAKIMREVAILKQLKHPNIVLLHKMEESERHYGIVLEYASGGELFDYILNHRYLRDNAARRLFAQLISGVGYLHKKGIVHRDLKLENLLLDRNRNIIITDFGFANTFDPNEELSAEEELNLQDKDFVKRMGLDVVNKNNMRKGDLMQTSCGSPCYAAPELVVSDSLYTGRKVDVWSCGVILYAMLAGYLPFDDDPDNPEGDNINLLYKYIVNTPLTFPEYVTPHARDLLRRILVPNPRKRADLFEVARHSWLSEFAHIVEFITSTTTEPGDVQNIPMSAEEAAEGSGLGRSASVREASKKTPVSPVVGGLTSKTGRVDPDDAAIAKQRRDDKRRTVQVEYVAPTTKTQRGEPATPAGRASFGAGPSPKDKPLPRDPPGGKDAYTKPAREQRGPPSAHRNNQNVPPTRPNREAVRAASDNVYMTPAGGASGRPMTGGSMASTGSRGPRASYGQPLAPTVANTNATGRIQQPTGMPKGYAISNPVPQDPNTVDYHRPTGAVPDKFRRLSGIANEHEAEGKGHRRSNTIGEIGGKLFGRSGSIFGGKKKRAEQQSSSGAEKPAKRYPPISMSNTMLGSEQDSRQSMDSKRSRRSFSIGLGKKRSGSIDGSQASQEKQNRRFSLIPNSFSLKSIGIGKDYGSSRNSQQDLPIQDPPRSAQQERFVDQRVDGPDMEASGIDGMYAQLSDPQHAEVAAANSSPMTPNFPEEQYPVGHPGRYHKPRPSGVPSYMQQGGMNTGSDSSVDQQRKPPGSAPYPPGYEQPQSQDHRRVASRGNRGVLQKNKRLVEGYDTDDFSRPHDHSGSSSAARKVMDFFRRRGKARGGDGS